jgi:hypothetical protein
MLNFYKKFYQNEMLVTTYFILSTFLSRASQKFLRQFRTITHQLEELGDFE